MVRQAFDVLGIEVTRDKRAIKKAYASLAKQYHPEEHPAEWTKIHEAYQTAMEFAQTSQELPPKTSGRAFIETGFKNGESEEEPCSFSGEAFAGMEGGDFSGAAFTDTVSAGASDEASAGSVDAGFSREAFTDTVSAEASDEASAGTVDVGSSGQTFAGTAGSVSSNAAYGAFFQEAQDQWVLKMRLHEQNIHNRLRELAGLRGRKAVREWRQFFETDFTGSEEEEALMLLLEELRENAFSEKVLRLILETMSARLNVYAEMGDRCRGLVAAEIVKYCSGQIPLMHRKAENMRKLIGIPAALAAAFLLLAMVGLKNESAAESDVAKTAAEYLNEKYGGSDYAAAELEIETVRLVGSNADQIDSYEIREPESGNTIAFAVRDTEAPKDAFACFDNIQEMEIREAFEKKLNSLTGHDEGRLFWNSSISDSMSGGLDDGFFQTKFEGDFDAFIRQETEARSGAPGVLTSFLISDYCPLNGLCDYYLPDPAVQTMGERFALKEYTEDTELQAALCRAAADYQIQIRGVMLPGTLFQEKTGQAAGKNSGIFVMKDVHGTLGMEPLMSFLMLTGWYVNLPPADEKILNISSGMYMQPVISMGEGIYGTENVLGGQGFAADPAWAAGSMVRTENPESLGFTEEEDKKAVSFRLADGYVLKNKYSLAIDKEFYGIADTGYRVMVTKQKGFSMKVADQYLEAEDGTAIEKYVSSYGDPGAMLGMGDVLDGEGYLFMEYQAAETAEAADIITVINP